MTCFLPSNFSFTGTYCTSPRMSGQAELAQLVGYNG